MKINPFRPNAPVHPGLFAGRGRELDRLESQLFQTKADRPGGFMLAGERGIGKTSLLTYVRAVASGGIPVEGHQLRYLVISTDITKDTTQLGLITKIELGLRNELEVTEPARQYLRKCWEFVQRIEAMGVKLKERNAINSAEVLLEQTAYSLASTIKSLTSSEYISTDFGIADSYDGVLLLIDEADNASSELDLGTFLKLLTERTYAQGCHRLLVGIAGLPALKDVLAKSHESSLRLFEELVLERLDRDEINYVIDKGLAEYEKLNRQALVLDDDARSALISLSEGLPHFVQQFCFSAVEADRDNHLTEKNVMDAAFREGGAIDQIGDRYYRNAYYNKIRKDTYRQVLRIMADGGSAWITKSEIRKKFSGKEQTLTNAISALLGLKVIVRKEGEPGTYRLVNQGFSYWLKLREIPTPKPAT